MPAEIDHDRHPGPRRRITQRRFGKRGTADIAEAHEQERPGSHHRFLH
ncbi:hypothetical protein [Sphingomonas hankookensis]